MFAPTTPLRHQYKRTTGALAMKRARGASLEREIEASRKRLCQVKREELAARDEMYKIQDQIDELATKLEEKYQARRTLNEGPLESAILSYSQACVLALTTKMQSCLPRELRDMVYSYLLDEYWYELENVLAVRSCLAFGKPQQFIDEETRNGYLSKNPWLIDQTYVGQSTAIEICQVFYSEPGDTETSQFYVEELKQIEFFIRTDVFEVGIDPATALRHLEIHLQLEQLLTKEEEKLKRQKLSDGLAPLLNIVNKAGFHLMIALKQTTVRLTVLEEALEVLRPIFESFNEQHALVEVKYTHSEKDHFEWCLEQALVSPESDWKLTMMYQLDKVKMSSEAREYRFEDHAGYVTPADTDFSDDEDDETQIGLNHFQTGWTNFLPAFLLHGPACQCVSCLQLGALGDLEESDDHEE